MKRHYVTVAGDRQVHYQRAGSGPPVVLCHESPLSSWSLLDLVEALSERFTVLALDTPGYGESDPLALETPEIEDYADALAQTLSALGVERAGIYGAHTGAAIALELACRHPDRVACVVVDGLPVFTEQEGVELLAHYLPTWPPRIDGSHLLGLWHRYRDQHLFFPWYRRDVAVRLDIDMPAPRDLQAGVLDFLRAGDGYRIGYAAAFRHRTVDRLAHAGAPVAVTARDDDLLAPQLERMPARTRTELLPRERGAWAARVGDLLAEHPGQAQVSDPPAPERLAGARLTRGYVGERGQQLLVRHAGRAGGRPLVLLHPAPVSGAVLRVTAQRLGATRPVFVLDLAGHGDSDPLPAACSQIGDYADAVLAATRALGLDAFDLYGAGEGAVVATEVAIRDGGRAAGRVVLDGMAPAAPEGDAEGAELAALLEPRRDGSHLASAWAMVRDRTLFWPWSSTVRTSIRWVPAADEQRLHRDVVEVLKAYPSVHRLAAASARHDLAARLPELRVAALVCADRHDPSRGAIDGLAALAPQARAAEVAPSLHGRVAAVAAFLDGAG